MPKPKSSTRVLRSIVLDSSASIELRLKALDQFLPSITLLARLIRPDQPASIRFEALKKYEAALVAARLLKEAKK